MCLKWALCFLVALEMTNSFKPVEGKRVIVWDHTGHFSAVTDLSLFYVVRQRNPVPVIPLSPHLSCFLTILSPVFFLNFFIAALQQLILLKYKTTTPPGFQLHFLYRSVNMCIFSTLYPWNCDFFFEKWYNSLWYVYSVAYVVHKRDKKQTNKKQKNGTYTKSKKERPPIYIDKFKKIFGYRLCICKNKRENCVEWAWLMKAFFLFMAGNWIFSLIWLKRGFHILCGAS